MTSFLRAMSLGLILAVVAAQPANALLFGVDAQNSLIYELDPDTGLGIRSFTTPTPTTPNFGLDGLAFSGDSLFYVNGQGSGIPTVYTVDPTTGATTNSFLAPVSNLDGLAFGASRFGPTLFGHSISPEERIYLINPDDGTVFDSFLSPVDPNFPSFPPRRLGLGELAFRSATGSLYGSGTIFDPLFEIDPNTGALLNSFQIPSPGGGFGLAFDGDRLFTTQIFDPNTPGALVELNPDTGAVIAQHPVSSSLFSALAGSPIPTASTPEPLTASLVWMASVAVACAAARRRSPE